MAAKISNFNPQDILIFGATGLIGMHITNALLAAKLNFRKIGIFTSAGSVERKAKVFDAFKAQGAEILIGDIGSEQDVLKAFKSYDTIISALGREALPKQIDLIRLAEESTSVRRLFPSEFGTDIEYSAASATEPVHANKIAVRHYFRNHVQRLEHTYLMTGPYADYYFGMGPVPGDMPQIGSFDVKAKQAWLLEPCEQKIAWTCMPGVGRFVVAALLHPDMSRNRALKVHSFIASHADILAEFEAQTVDKETWQVGYTLPEELRRCEERACREDLWSKATCSLRRLWMRGETLYPEFDNGVLGNPETMTLADVVRATMERTK